MECRHEFIGDSKGVQCRLCGKRMTAEEYREHLEPPEQKGAEPEQKDETPKKPAKKAAHKTDD